MIYTKAGKDEMARSSHSFPPFGICIVYVGSLDFCSMFSCAGCSMNLLPLPVDTPFASNALSVALTIIHIAHSAKKSCQK